VASDATESGESDEGRLAVLLANELSVLSALPALTRLPAALPRFLRAARFTLIAAFSPLLFPVSPALLLLLTI